jgi:nuclear GTP-binding protein
VRLRHSVAKASAAKQRKGKKLAKKDVTWKSKLKKDPGIQENRRRKDEETVRRKALAKAQDQGLDIAADAMVDDEDDVEDKDNSLDLDSEDENSMQVVRAFCFSSLGYLYQH